MPLGGLEEGEREREREREEGFACVACICVCVCVCVLRACFVHEAETEAPWSRSAADLAVPDFCGSGSAPSSRSGVDFDAAHSRTQAKRRSLGVSASEPTDQSSKAFGTPHMLALSGSPRQPASAGSRSEGPTRSRTCGRPAEVSRPDVEVAWAEVQEILAGLADPSALTLFTELDARYRQRKPESTHDKKLLLSIAQSLFSDKEETVRRGVALFR